jgi:hypothetical protein
LQPSETLLPSTSGLKPCPGLENGAHFSLFHQSINHEIQKRLVRFRGTGKGERELQRRTTTALDILCRSQSSQRGAERKAGPHHICRYRCSIALRLRREGFPLHSISRVAVSSTSSRFHSGSFPAILGTRVHDTFCFWRQRYQLWNNSASTNSYICNLLFFFSFFFKSPKPTLFGSGINTSGYVR